FFFSSRRRHTRSKRDWSSDVCSSDLIVNTASVAAFASGAPMMIPYCASKMAILGMTESLEAELRTNNSSVHLSVLAPGPVKTNKIGRASCRERVEASGDAGPLQTKKT